MERGSQKLRYNLAGLFIGVAGFVAVVVYGSIALAAQDALWFVPGFHDAPAQIIIYKAGARTVLRPGQPGFAELSSAVMDSLNQGVARQSGIGLSPGSLQDAYTQFETVEVFFNHPVKLHTPFFSPEATQMLFATSGRHAELSVAFMGDRGVYYSNSPALNTIEPIRAALKNLGY